MLEFLSLSSLSVVQKGQWKNFSNGDITVKSGLLKGYYCTLYSTPRRLCVVSYPCASVLNILHYIHQSFKDMGRSE
jgi:hypothetical protein